jgi:hypothetical protein
MKATRNESHLCEAICLIFFLVIPYLMHEQSAYKRW